jgi:hypothetical protein
MSRTCIVDLASGAVVNVVDAGTEDEPPQGARFVQSDTAQIGWTMGQNGVFVAPPGPPRPAPSYRDRRAAAYRDALGVDKYDFIRTLGDVADVVIGQLEALRAELGAHATPEFAAMIDKIRAIKTAIPKE